MKGVSDVYYSFNNKILHGNGSFQLQILKKDFSLFCPSSKDSSLKNLLDIFDSRFMHQSSDIVVITYLSLRH